MRLRMIPAVLLAVMALSSCARTVEGVAAAQLGLPRNAPTDGSVTVLDDIRTFGTHRAGPYPVKGTGTCRVSGDRVSVDLQDSAAAVDALEFVTLDAPVGATGEATALIQFNAPQDGTRYDSSYYSETSRKGGSATGRAIVFGGRIEITFSGSTWDDVHFTGALSCPQG